MPLDPNQIFAYHKLSEDQVTRTNKVRTACHAAAEMIIEATQEGPEQTIAIRYLQQAMMISNSAIAQEP